MCFEGFAQAADNPDIGGIRLGMTAEEAPCTMIVPASERVCMSRGRLTRRLSASPSKSVRRARRILSAKRTRVRSSSASTTREVVERA